MLHYKHEFWSYSDKPISEIRVEICNGLKLSFDILEIRMISFILVNDENDKNIFDLILQSEKYEDIDERKYFFRCSLIINIKSDLIDIDLLGNLISKSVKKKVFYGLAENCKSSKIQIQEIEIIKSFIPY